MPQIRIPDLETKSFVRPDDGEVFGNIWASRNIDFSRNKGKALLSERLYRLFDSGDDADFEVPVAIIRTNADQTDRWWLLGQTSQQSPSDGLLFKSTNTSPTSAWAQDAIASSPTTAVDDMEIFGTASAYDRLVVATATDLSMLNNGAWTASWWDTTLAQAALSNANPHILHQFLNVLIVTDGNVAHTIDDSLVVVASRITLPAEYQIIWVRDDGLRVYFGTKHKRNGEALVFPWDGTSDKYDEPIPVNSSISFAGCVKNGVMHTVNGNGQLLAFNGQAFAEVAHFPVKNSALRWYYELSLGTRGTVNTVLHHNGMEVVDGNIHIMISGGLGNATSNPYSNFPGGIWEYNEKVGLYCKYAFGQYDGTTDNDWGGIGSVFLPGAIKATVNDAGRFLAGASVETNNTATQIRVLMATEGASTANQRGYFITAEFSSGEFQALWKRIKSSFRKLENSTDRIVIKFRTEKDTYFTETNRTSITAAWTDTDTFTSTSTELANAVVGDEVEVLCGKGAGALAHITAISYSAPTYTVDIDEAIPNVSGNSIVRIRNWKKLGSVSDQNLDRKIYTLTKRSKNIQIKVELRGTETSPELEQILLEFNASKR